MNDDDLKKFSAINMPELNKEKEDNFTKKLFKIVIIIGIVFILIVLALINMKVF